MNILNIFALDWQVSYQERDTIDGINILQATYKSI